MGRKGSFETGSSIPGPCWFGYGIELAAHSASPAVNVETVAGFRRKICFSSHHALVVILRLSVSGAVRCIVAQQLYRPTDHFSTLGHWNASLKAPPWEGFAGIKMSRLG